MSSPPTRSTDSNAMATLSSSKNYDSALDLCETTMFRVLLPENLTEGNKIEFNVPGYGYLRYKVTQNDINTGHIIITGEDLP